MRQGKGRGPVEDIIGTAENLARLAGMRAQDAKTLHTVTKKLRPHASLDLLLSTRRALDEHITATLSNVQSMRRLRERLCRLEIISKEELRNGPPSA